VGKRQSSRLFYLFAAWTCALASVSCAANAPALVAREEPALPTGSPDQPAGDASAATPVAHEEATLFTESPLAARDDATGDPTVVRARHVEPDLSLLAGAEVGDAVPINLFEDAIYTAVLDRGEAALPEGYTWIGHLEGVDYSQVILTVGGGQVAGNITLPGAFYQVRYMGDGVHAIYQIDQAAFPPEAESVSLED
jgi:hypothetical protein